MFLLYLIYYFKNLVNFIGLLLKYALKEFKIKNKSLIKLIFLLTSEKVGVSTSNYIITISNLEKMDFKVCRVPAYILYILNYIKVL